MRRIFSAAAPVLLALCTGCAQAPTEPQPLHPSSPVFDGVGFGSGHFSEPPTETTAISFETAAVMDSISRGGPGFGSGH